DFRSNRPTSYITLTPCSPPSSISGQVTPVQAPSTYAPSNSINVTAPNVYGRADGAVGSPTSSTSIWPTSAPFPPVVRGFTSHGGTTTNTAEQQWYGGSSSNTN